MRGDCSPPETLWVCDSNLERKKNGNPNKTGEEIAKDMWGK